MRTSIFYLSFFLIACGNPAEKSQSENIEKQEVNIYSHRHYDIDQQLFDQFEEKYGIKVNVVKAEADELMERLTREGESSPADLLFTVDAGRLYRAKTNGLLQSINSDILKANIPPRFRDPDDQWFGITMRARVIAYSKERVSPTELSTYEALTDPKWKGKILVRSSENIYNQSLLASLIYHLGEEKAGEWVQGIVSNFARDPKGSDRDQVKAIKEGLGDLAIVNTYYIGKLLSSTDPNEVEAGESIKIFFPDQEGNGTHVNTSGAGVCKYAPNKENAIKLLEFLSESENQKQFAEANFEYPVNESIGLDSMLNSWGQFKQDQMALSELGELNQKAVMLFDRFGWN